jgi:predicted extracellular nuclease
MPVWINEIHYDNAGTDTNEGVEIAGTAGTNLTGWTIVLYNGANGQTYTPLGTLTGTIPNQQNGFGTVYIALAGIQNGAPDGLALVDNNGVVVQFLSYEGTFAATNGPANGMTSVSIGVLQAGTVDPDTITLQLQGTGSQYSDFTWASATATRGGVNTGQTFQAVGPVTPTLNISDVSTAEGTIPGTTIFTFSVSLTAPAGPGGVTFDIATADGTAQDDNPTTEDSDYVAQSLTGQTIPAGSTGPYTFSVTVNTDNVIEGNETFFVNVTNITGATAGDVQGQGTIQNDDTPVLTIANVSQAEGNSGTSVFTFTVSLDRAAPFGGVTFDIATQDGSAAAGSDYVSRTLTTQTIPEGQSSYTFDVTVNGDTAIEPDETFLVNVTNVINATVGDGQATGTIQNEDSSNASITDVTIVEGNSGVTYAVFTVTLDNPPTAPVTFDYATSSGTATAGSDYLAVSGQISFGVGETVKTISVPIVGDSVSEGNETFTVTLSNPTTGGGIADGSALGTITNDDGPGYFALATGSFAQNWINTGQITTADNWSGVPFIIGYLGDTDPSGSATGVDPRTLTGANLGAVDVIPNLTVTTSLSGGVGEFEIANPTIGIQGSGTADAPSIVLYMDASGRSGVRVQATLRDIDTTADDAVQPIAVQYRTSPNGTWINAPGGYFADVTTGGSATQTTLLDITLPAGANNAPTLQIRILTTNAPGNDEWVGIDDIVVSSAQAAPNYSVADAAAFEGTGGGTTPIVFTVSRAGDASAAGTVDYAVTFAGGGFSADATDLASALSGTVSFAIGETSRTITLDIAADSNPEADEGFTVTLSNPSSGTIGDSAATGTIVNDDGTPPFVTIADVVQAEGNAGASLFTFTVTRTGGSGAFTVDYATTGTGSATPGDDYVATSGTLSFAAGENSKTFTVTVNGDANGELAETFGVQLSNPTGFAVIADPTATGTIQNDDLIFIHDIQGTSYYSPILASEGTTSFNTASTTIVIVRAVVTAVDNDGPRQGFYITEETTDWDGNSFTSEGIFVMTRNDAGVGAVVSGVAVGDLVTVSAQVMEYQAFQSMPRTVLVNSTTVINSSGSGLPTLVLDAGWAIPNSIMTLVTPDYTDSADGAGDTFDASLYALSFWETVEGMLVTIPDMVVADGFVSTSGGQPIFQAYSRVHADSDQINSRGGYTIAGDPPLGPPDTADTEDGTIAGGRHLHDGDINPDIIEIDFSGFAIDAPAGLAQQATMGDRLGDVTGIVEFDFTDRKLFVTDIDPTAITNAVPVRETTTLTGDARSLTVATFNVENLDPGDGAARFTALADAIANNLNTPDIILIEEIQDNNGQTNNGVTDASLTWQMLVDALNLATGEKYQWVDQEPVNNAEGGAGGGNIRVGFLYNMNRVQLGDLDETATLAERRQYTDRIGDGVRDAGDLIAFSDDMVAAQINPADWSATRLSLLGQFTFNGETVFITANHFTAKGGSGEFWQIDQDLAAGEPANSGWARRAQQAEDVYAMLNHIQANSGEVGIVAGGDMNDFYFYDPLTTVTGYTMANGTARVGGARFDNLTLTLAEAERYTYTFDGRSQAIDHVIASQNLAAFATYDVVHINTGYNGSGTGADASPRLSDHDPAVARFDFGVFSETLIGTPQNDVFLLHQGGDDNVSGLAGRDVFYFGAAFTTADVVDGGGNADIVILQGNYTTSLNGISNLGNLGSISLFSGSVTSYGDTANNFYDYNLVSADSNVGAGQVLKINGSGLRVGEDLTFDGSAETDGSFRFYGGLGVDRLTGGAQNDNFFFGHNGSFGSSDRVNGGTGGYDVLYLRGDYAIDFNAGGFGASTLTGIDSIGLLSFTDTEFASGGDGEFDYALTWNDAMLATGQTITVNGSRLTASETMVFDGSSEAGGHFKLWGGAAADTLRGGSGNDLLYGGLGGDTLDGNGGVDTYRYQDVLESTSAGFDTIEGFTHLVDKIDLNRVDANSLVGGDQAFSFIGAAAFSGTGNSSAGQLRAVQVNLATNLWQVEGDVNGDGVADLVIQVYVEAGQPLTAGDFFP